ncbi:MAG: TA system VapC family ribonuclease toxin [Acidimicrobiia bacterium]
MLLCDVNALVYAHRADAVQHTAYRAWLDEVRIGAEPLGLPEQVLAGFVRVVTHPRIFRDPTSPTIALSFVNRLRVSPAAVVVRPCERAWPVFDELVTRRKRHSRRISGSHDG